MRGYIGKRVCARDMPEVGLISKGFKSLGLLLMVDWEDWRLLGWILGRLECLKMRWGGESHGLEEECWR